MTLRKPRTPARRPISTGRSPERYSARTPPKPTGTRSSLWVYGKLYGAGIPTLAAQAGCRLDVAEAVVTTLDAITPTLAQWSAKLRARVEAGLVTFPSYFGAMLHLPHGRPHAAPNYAIQRTAREILVDAMLRWRDTQWGNGVLLPVHDELIAMVPEQDGPAATAALVACMQTEFHGVSIVAEADEPNRAWADAA